MDAIPVNTVSGIGSREDLARVGLTTEKAIAVPPPTGPPVEDIVELSPTGMALSRVVGQSPQRAARLSEIRAAIEAGTFETPERINGTVERLLKILG